MALSAKDKKRLKTAAIIAGVLIVAYFAYQWWQNRQANNGTGSSSSTTGSNLNSIAPYMVSGANTGGSGLTYTAPNYDINLTLPNGNSPVDNTSPSAASHRPRGG